MIHNFTYAVTAALVLALMLFIKPVIVYTPCGIALPISTTSAPASDQVSILPPWHNSGKKLAWINVEYHQDQQSEQAAKKIAEFGSLLAKQQGANGLKVNVVGYQPPTAQGEPMAMYVLRGVAVHDV